MFPIAWISIFSFKILDKFSFFSYLMWQKMSAAWLLSILKNLSSFSSRLSQPPSYLHFSGLFFSYSCSTSSSSWIFVFPKALSRFFFLVLHQGLQIQLSPNFKGLSKMISCENSNWHKEFMTPNAFKDQ